MNSKTRRSPHKYTQLIFEKDTKSISCRKDSLSTSNSKVTEHSQVKIMNINVSFISYTNIERNCRHRCTT
jgi:flagellin-specific chaperone FliS